MDAKLKKKIIMLRNKKNQRIFQHARIHKAEHERIVDEEEARLSGGEGNRSRDKQEEKEVWSAKTQEIRNRLNNKKRDAKDRWNRFSGTEGAGGRGL